MDTKVYYGEYTLDYWIRLLLNKDIRLPQYQRKFVWSESDQKRLMDSFELKQFIPPVTIGVFKINEEQENLIIDGQQRLTSILLAYLGIFPKLESFRVDEYSFVDDNDGDSDEDEPDNMMEWTFQKLLDKGSSKEEIVNQCSEKEYKTCRSYKEEYFTKNFLGFSYIIPKVGDEKEQSSFFSTLFRNINISGKSLYVLESRRSLYFLDPIMSKWFEPVFCDKISSSTVDRSMRSRMDFVRYLSLLSQYKVKGKEKALGYGYARCMEMYYEKYIYSVVNGTDQDVFGDFESLFPGKNFEPQLTVLSDFIEKNGYKRQFKSIIDQDVFFFGLIYFVLFEKKEKIDTEGLSVELEDKISTIKENPAHVKSPACLKYLRVRLAESIAVYETHIQ
ncbi:MAG: DUF262 domain-containing protein [Clostridia bacterium]|nr:DUF262 domain-containing protein [Clostridia bacterium]